MNKRIAELYDQALVITGNGDYFAGELDIEKFGTLIAQECINLSQETALKHQVTGTTYAAGMKAGAFECADVIKKHFGVA